MTRGATAGYKARMAVRVRLVSGLLALTLLAACAAPTTPPTTGGGTKPRPRPSGGPGIAPTGDQPGGLLASPGASAGPGLVGASTLPLGPGGGLISDGGGGVVANNGAAIVGKVKGPAGIIANNGSGLVSNNGGGVMLLRRFPSVTSNNGGSYRLKAVDEVPGAGLEVELQRADGTPILDATGQRIKAITGPDGGYRLPFPGSGQHALVAVKLPADRGKLLAFVPRGEIAAAAPKEVDVDLTSTYTMGYILEKYVKGQADPVATLEKLPPALEAETRTVVATAVAKETVPPPTLTATEVVATVERIRGADPAVDAQLEEVRAVLAAGLSNQGAGQPADSVETDAASVALAPSGDLVFAGVQTRRIWKKDAAGKLTPIAGSGLNPIITYPGAADPAPGDGGPAIEAYIGPVAVTYAADGTMLILDKDLKRVRAVDAAGTISTRAAHADWTELRDVVAEPDGGLVVATHAALWRVAPGERTPTLIAGEVRAFDGAKWITAKASGDGGPPAAARFTQIMAISRDPSTGDILVFDGAGQVRRVGKDLVTRVAGTDKAALPGEAASGDGGPATAATLGRLGGVVARPDGTVVILDAGTHRIHEVKDGTLRFVAGSGRADLANDGGDALAAGTIEPRFPILAPDGTVYFTDQGFVRWWSKATGKLGTIIGGTRGFDSPRPARDVQLNAPVGLTYDAAADALLVTDSRHVWRWTLADDRIAAVFGGGPGGEAYVDGAQAARTNLFAPRAVQLEGPDRWVVFASDPATYAGRVLRVAGGAMTMIAGGVLTPGALDKDAPAAIGATIVATDIAMVPHDGGFLYTLISQARVRKFVEGGAVTKWAGYGTATADGTPALDFKFSTYMYMMAKGPDGMVYAADAGKIYRIDPTTTEVTWIAGTGYGFGQNGPAKETKIGMVGGFAWDAAGHMYFSEPEQACVRRLRKDTGMIERVAGENTPNLAGKTIDGGLSAPSGLAFGKDGDLYVADFRHGQIKVVPKAQLGP